ncbi:MAG TPA: hypothetical protein PK970_01935 [Hyphomicrobiaceae bacterium]|nr:hypothetical protein [Hyphomicrobiaceae bacterium]
MATSLATLLGDHATTRPLKRGDITSPELTLDFADVKVPNTAFKRAVRDLEFDVTELAIVTLLMARSRGVPLTLLPVVVMARFQHPFLVHDKTRGTLTPMDLEGRHVVVRSWSVTTAMWLRDTLAREHGVDLGRIRWSTLEDAHVAGWSDPPGIERLPPGTDPIALLKSGAADAAIVGALPGDPAIRPVIADPDAAAERWRQTNGAIQVNHVVAVKTDLCRKFPDTVRRLYRLFVESRNLAIYENPGAGDLAPIGRTSIRRSLEVAIDATARQGLIPARLTVDELYDQLPDGVG